MRVSLWIPPDDAEGAATLAWCAANSVSVEIVSPGQAVDTEAPVWVHAGSRVPELGGDLERTLAEHVARGGTVVLTLLATPIAQRLGAPGPAPECEGPAPWRHQDDPRWPAAFREWPGYPHIRGVQGYGAHPLFGGLVRGTFSWMAREGDLVARTMYKRPQWPDGGVIGVDRSYVHLDADEVVAWEYAVGAGTIRCVGAHLCLTSGDPLLHAQRDTVLRNLLARDWGANRRVWWPTARGHHASVTPVPSPRPLPPLREAPAADLTIRAAVDAPWPVTLGTPHGLMTGTASGGARELWLHPVCLLDGGLEIAGSGGAMQVREAEVSGGHLRRWLASDSGTAWVETLVGDVHAPAWYHELSPVVETSESIAVEFRVPLRLAWPMPSALLRPIRVETRTEADRASILVSGSDGQHRVCISVDGVEAVTVEADDVAPLVRVVGRPGVGLRLAWRATATQHFAPLRGAAAAVEGQAEREASLRARTVSWHHEGELFDTAFAWARSRLANFLTGNLQGQTGLVAGYAGTRPGWNHSRPGYAWFFGRDTCWCVDAMLALGMFEEARTAIDLLVSTADVTGKVAHEVSMSGVAHYDAADATPLLVRAVGLFAAWTGDVDTVRRWWPAVRRAVSFVAACDRDYDGLPENDGIGHGWIEMGPLGGGSVTSYVAACWIDALGRIADAAHAVDPEWVPWLQATRQRAEAAMEGLRLPNGRLALHRDASGRLESELTALAAVPIALGVDRSSSRDDVLRELAQPRYMSPKGLRLIPVDSPRYDPRGYHSGAVWPLFTGWAAMADAVVGAADRAVERLGTIAGLIGERNLGAFDEVLNGDTGEGAGVCSDQGWSAAALVSPMMHGVLGLTPHGCGSSCGLRVQLPPRLHGLTLSGLRTGRTRWSARWESGRVVVEHLEGPPLHLHATDAACAVDLGATDTTRRQATLTVGDR